MCLLHSSLVLLTLEIAHISDKAFQRHRLFASGCQSFHRIFVIRAVDTLRFVARLSSVGHIYFFAFAVVTFHSQILAFCLLVRLFTSVFSLVFFRVNCQPLSMLILFPLCFRDFLYLPVLSCHPQCLQSDEFSGSSQHHFAKGSVHLSQGFFVCESMPTELLLYKRPDPILPIPDKPFFCICFSVGIPSATAS